MRISQLELTNWLAHRHLSIDLQPLHVIAGPNESGKSSIADGLAFGLMGALRRISLAGDRPLLISQGASKGQVALRAGEGTEAVQLIRDIATGKPRGAGGTLPTGQDAVRSAAGYILDPALFAETDENTRRTMLLDVMRVSLNPGVLKGILLERGHPPELLANLPETESLSEWEKRCKAGASEARGAWAAVTGETYGAVKAEAWEAPMPAENAVSAEEHAAARERVSGLSRQRDDLLREQAVAASQAEQRRKLTERQAALKRQLEQQPAAFQATTAAQASVRQATDRVAAAEAALLDVRARMPTPALYCTACNAPHAIGQDGKLVPITVKMIAGDATTKGDETNAISALGSAKADLKTAAAALTRCETDELEIGRARAALDEVDSALASLDPPATTVADEVVTAIQERLAAAMDELAVMEAGSGEAARALQETKRAAEFHFRVQRWTALAAAVAPDGIAAELLGKGLEQFNAALAKTMTAFGWPVASVGGDMAITRAGLPYALLSESARWRVDVAIAITLARLSALRFVVLDRMDVLEIPARQGFLVALHRMISQQEMDTVIVMGTFKEMPRMPGDVGRTWLGG